MQQPAARVGLGQASWLDSRSYGVKAKIRLRVFTQITNLPNFILILFETTARPRLFEQHSPNEKNNKMRGSDMGSVRGPKIKMQLAT